VPAYNEYLTKDTVLRRSSCLGLGYASAYLENVVIGRPNCTLARLTVGNRVGRHFDGASVEVSDANGTSDLCMGRVVAGELHTAYFELPIVPGE